MQNEIGHRSIPYQPASERDLTKLKVVYLYS